MKGAAIAICLLCLRGIAAANSYMVETLAEQPSVQDVLSTTRLDGKPAKGVRVDFYPYETGQLIVPGSEQDLQPRLSREPDAAANFRISKLRPGFDYVAATAKTNNDMRAVFLDVLDVLARSPQRKSTFSMPLVVKCNMAPPVRAQWTPNAEQMPVKERVQSFGGVVNDQTGAPVAGTSIKVIRRGTQGRVQVADLRSDARGRFATELPEGLYIGFFFSPGFNNAYAVRGNKRRIERCSGHSDGGKHNMSVNWL